MIKDRVSSPASRAPILGLFNGVIIGWGGGGLLLIFGLVFWPFLIAAVIFFIGGPLLGFSTWKGACPNCTRPVMGLNSTKCSTCKHRLAVIDRRFVDVT